MRYPLNPTVATSALSSSYQLSVVSVLFNSSLALFTHWRSYFLKRYPRQHPEMPSNTASGVKPKCQLKGARAGRKRRATSSVIDSDVAKAAKKKNNDCADNGIGNDAEEQITGIDTPNLPPNRNEIGTEDQNGIDKTVPSSSRKSTTNTSRSAINLSGLPSKDVIQPGTRTGLNQCAQRPVVGRSLSKDRESYSAIAAKETAKSPVHAMSNLVMAMERRLTEELKYQIAEQTAVFTNRIDKVEKMLGDIHTAIQSRDSSLTCGKGGVNRKNRKGVVSDRMFTTYSKIIDKKLLQYAAERCVIGKTNIILTSTMEMLFNEKTALSIQSMMFSRHPEDCKSVFHSIIGVQYCALRRSIIITTLTNAVKDVFGRFRSPQKEVNDRSGSSNSSLVCTDGKLDRPFWCAPKFIDKAHIELVQHRSENLQSKEARTRAQAQSKDEVPVLAADMILSSVTSWMSRARERAKKCLFEELGFLFVNWSSFDVKCNQSRMEFVWEKEIDNIGFDYDCVQDAKVINVHKSDTEVESTKRYNLNQWTAMIDKNSQFILLVAYDVWVRTEKQTKRDKDGTVDDKAKNDEASNKDGTVDDRARDDEASNSGGSDGRGTEQETESSSATQPVTQPVEETYKQGRRETMYRSFNLLDTALLFLSSYCGYKTAQTDYPILGSSINSLRAIYAFAHLFREWVLHLVEDYNMNGPAGFFEGKDEQNNHITNNLVNGLSMHHLFPCFSKKKSALFTSCLHLTPEEFNADCFDERRKMRFSRYRTELRSKQLEEQQCNHGGSDKDRDDDNESDEDEEHDSNDFLDDDVDHDLDNNDEEGAIGGDEEDDQDEDLF